MILNDRDAVIVAYGRSAVCKAYKGSFANVHIADYTAQVLNKTIAKLPQIKPEDIDDIVIGMSCPNENMARVVTTRAQLPCSVPAQTVNRFCSSGLQTIATCANAIMAGQAEIIVAGGMEHMSDMPRGGIDPGKGNVNEWVVKNDPGVYMPMGVTAENVADYYHVTREDMDAAAAESHRKAYEAQQAGYLNEAIVPVIIDGKEVLYDEGIRPGTTVEGLSTLKTVFRENGTVTAGNSSQMSDGAAFAVLMSGAKAKELGVTPIARFVAFSAAGCRADRMGEGPIYAVPKVMKLAGLTIDDMDVIELNEAFASQFLACIRTLDLPVDKVNPWGGAMALGHPAGATGVFLTTKALDYLKHTGGRYALVTMCIGGGMGAAGIFEMLY